MKKEMFIRKWLRVFAFDVDRKELKKYSKKLDSLTNNYLWALCASKQIDAYDKDNAIKKYNVADKNGAIIINMDTDNESYCLPEEYYNADSIANWSETMIVGNNFSWCYIITHEADIGPFFIERKYDEEMNRVFETLYKNPNICDRIEFVDEEKEVIMVKFHEYLTIVGSIYGNGVFEINSITHLHIEDANYLINWLNDIANGELIFIENRCWFSIKRFSLLQPWNLKTIRKSKFEKKKNKYLRKKYYRIYSGKEIIKN